MATADAGKAVMKLVRLHLRRDGEIVDTSEDFELGEFADSLPAPGDKIVLPWARDGGSRTDPENRAVHEVEERYFLPNAYGRDPAKAEDTATNRIVHVVALVVKERSAEDSERPLLW